MINVSIIGANGYTGLELLKILSLHKYVNVKKIVSKSNAGTKISDMYPHLETLKGRTFDGLAIKEIAKSDVVFTALPHGVSAGICSDLIKLNDSLKIIDLSADFRYNDVSVYQKVYGYAHPDEKLLKTSVYGLPEIYFEKIKSAKLVANPGCYTTCSILPLYPLTKEKLINPDTIIIDAKSGVSGAGKKAETAYGFCEINENFSAYAVTTHRHTSEIEQEISLAAGKNIRLCFTPHLLPVQRGILSTIYCDLNKNACAEEIDSIYKKYYKDKPFIYVNDIGQMPQLKEVKNTNNLKIGYQIDYRLNKLIVVSVLDNLIKGASGQAVQNMNIMFGLNQDEGLNLISNYI
ncbi:MAG: N-acetyl-gamma-glutamyl-phosphate reductase [Firmicutes bacterium]|nr:N-acetyl-gamma-glutamyl-phosphate reductase [Bacillota bacterium]